MSDQDTGTIEAATRRLLAALEALEAAVERRRDGDLNEERLVERIHQLGADRSRLANELDGVTAQARSLEQVNRDVSKRIEIAVGAVRAVLDSHDA